jgi:mycofactocin precursor peptide peptidase
MSPSLASLTSAAAKRRADAVLVVPVGATEQHGPHLPLSTDTDIAVALCRRVAVQVPDAIIAPPIAYGASGEHQEFAGTLSVGRAATELLLLELGRSATETFRRVVLVSSHGGNAEPVTRATRRLRQEGRMVMSWQPRLGGDAHAGRAETSIMLALDPARVRSSDAAAGNPAPLAELWPMLRSGGVRAVSASGVLGDPSGASAAEGRRLLEAAAADLVAAVRGWIAEVAEVA